MMVTDGVTQIGGETLAGTMTVQLASGEGKPIGLRPIALLLFVLLGDGVTETSELRGTFGVTPGGFE
jgi:hypothetical protein